MKLRSIILPAAALGAAALLLTPSEIQAFDTLGGSLNLSQRDVRVFNNFTDAAANNNTATDTDWPGYDGAEQAIWKACTEWGSELHGLNGNGDPHQSGGLGSGGANFDITWQGNATAIGNTNQNIHSEISGGSGGVLAYCETPISDGWRIRYYESWTWQDGPGTAVGGGNNIDLQGVACHEYGHALGLDHSTVGGATMFPSISGNGVAARSINSDDIAGVQFIYGSASATKPRITGVTSGSTITITGSQFAATGNEVWFTQAGSGGTGTAVKVTGVNSNGSSMTVTVPGGAGPGDILVKKGGVSGNAGLSNQWPFQPGPGGGGNKATSINIDVGSAAGTPGSGYGAAAGSAGTWNTIVPPVTGVALADLTGAATSSTVTATGGGEFNQDNANTSGNDEALMDDVQDVGGVGSTATWTIANLAAGDYDVYVYAWAPDDRVGFLTDIEIVGGANGTQTSGGAVWGGSHVEGSTYVRDTVTVSAGGSININATTNTGFGSVNGIQIVDVSGSCGQMVNYGVGGTTTNFCQATMTGTGTPSASAGSGFTLSSTNMEGNKQGLIFYGINGRRNTPWGSSTSTLLVQGPTQRTPAGTSSGASGTCNGVLSIDWNTFITQPGKLGVPFSGGEQVNAQCWFRDPPSIETTHLSNAIEFIVCP